MNVRVFEFENDPIVNEIYVPEHKSEPRTGLRFVKNVELGYEN